MSYDKLIDNCQVLERTISVLIKTNFNKLSTLNKLQNKIFDESQITLEEVLQKEYVMQQNLDSMKLKKNDLEMEIKQYSDINDKLSDLVAIIQRSDYSDTDGNDCESEINPTIDDALNEFAQVKQDCARVRSKVLQMIESLESSKEEFKETIVGKQDVVLDLQRNDAELRLLEQQNKFAEQQFELIINQMPWEPLPDLYIDDIRKSNSQACKDLAVTLQLQKNEIEDLTESINVKKSKKLKVLEDLYSELNSFIQKRDEAALITRVLDG